VKFVRDVGLSPEANKEGLMIKKQFDASKNVKARNRNMVIRDEAKKYAALGKIPKARGSAQHSPLLSGFSYSTA
jgi:hypothetical protein